MTYMVRRSSLFNSGPAIETYVGSAPTLEGAIALTCSDYGTDTGDGYWHNDRYLIHCGPFYREGDDRHLVYEIQKSPQRPKIRP